MVAILEAGLSTGCDLTRVYDLVTTRVLLKDAGAEVSEIFELHKQTPQRKANWTVTLITTIAPNP